MKSLIFYSLFFFSSGFGYSSPIGAQKPDLNSKGGLQKAINVGVLTPPSETEVLASFGAIKDGKKIVVRNDYSKPMPKKYNMLTMIGVDKATRDQLYSKSACGKRQYQFISVMYSNDLEGLGVSYQCDGSCGAIYEKHQQDNKTWTKKLVGMSDYIALPNAFCDALWNGQIKVDMSNED